jgi:hypothetical protein
MQYAVHLDTCIRFETMEEEMCDCGLLQLEVYVRKLAPHKYDADGELKPQYR